MQRVITRGINLAIGLFLALGVLAFAASRAVSSKVSLAASSSGASTVIKSHYSEMRGVYSASLVTAAILMVAAGFMIHRSHRKSAA